MSSRTIVGNFITTESLSVDKKFSENFLVYYEDGKTFAREIKGYTISPSGMFSPVCDSELIPIDCSLVGFSRPKIKFELFFEDQYINEYMFNIEIFNGEISLEKISNYISQFYIDLMNKVQACLGLLGIWDKDNMIDNFHCIVSFPSMPYLPITFES